MKIKALKNFGHQGENIQPGAVVDVEPNDFGGTYDDFKTAGYFEEGCLKDVDKPDGSRESQWFATIDANEPAAEASHGNGQTSELSGSVNADGQQDAGDTSGAAPVQKGGKKAKKG